MGAVSCVGGQVDVLKTELLEIPRPAVLREGLMNTSCPALSLSPFGMECDTPVKRRSPLPLHR